MNFKRRINLISFLACMIAGIFAAIDLKGTEVGLGQLLAIFFSGFGGGALLVVFIRGFKKH